MNFIECHFSHIYVYLCVLYKIYLFLSIINFTLYPLCLSRFCMVNVCLRSKTRVKLSCLYLELPSFKESKAFKDKVTPLTSALCARAGGWTWEGENTQLLITGAWIWQRDKAHTLRRSKAAQGFQGCSCKKESESISSIWMHCLLHANHERVCARIYTI